MIPRITVEGHAIQLELASHAYLVFRDAAGREFYISAFPLVRGAPFFTTIDVEAGVPSNLATDARPSEQAINFGARELNTGNQKAADIWSIMVQYADQLDRSNLSYVAFPNSQNSNSVAASLLYLVGLDPATNRPLIDFGALGTVGVGYPGWSTILSFNYTIQGTAHADTIRGAGGNQIFYGLGGSDHLFGGSGADQLNGGSGADVLDGGTGNDFYFVDNSADVVTEAVEGGNDTIYTTVSYTLAAGAEIESLVGQTAASQRLVLTGNEFSNEIIGGIGNDVIDGKAGIDVMRGGFGNDVYYVNTISDGVDEKAGQGKDTVYTSVSYTLAPGSEVEVLEALPGSSKLNLTGNEFANRIIGTSSNDRINGAGGADTMMGGDGFDTYIFDNNKDRAIEAKQHLTGLVGDEVQFDFGGVMHSSAGIERYIYTGQERLDLTFINDKTTSDFHFIDAGDEGSRINYKSTGMGSDVPTFQFGEGRDSLKLNPANTTVGVKIFDFDVGVDKINTGAFPEALGVDPFGGGFAPSPNIYWESLIFSGHTIQINLAQFSTNANGVAARSFTFFSVEITAPEYDFWNDFSSLEKVEALVHAILV